MMKAQLGGMEVITGIAGQGSAIRRGDTARRIEWVAHQGMAHSRQVDANLMGPARDDVYIAQRGNGAALQHGHSR